MSFSYIRLLTKLKTSNEVYTKLSRQYHLPSNMKCMVLNGYADSAGEIKSELELNCPTEEDLKPNQALVKVHAASINPLDLEMMKGFGRKKINLLRKQANVNEFPLVLGRDYSGVIVKRGKKFRRFEIGDHVYGISGLCHQGSHAEYTIVNKHEVSPKPSNIDFIEAASIPGVGCIAWSVLIDTGAIPVSGKKRKIFIPGGSGGLGTFTTQLCLLHGHDVVTTCATDAVPLLESLGIKNIIDYQSATYEDDVRSAGPFDVILGTLSDEKHVNFFQELMNPRPGSQYISLHSNLLEDADKKDLALGGAEPVHNVFQFTINQVYTGKGLFQWGFNGHNGRVLSNIKEFIEDGLIRPVVDKVFQIEDVVSAYKFAEAGNARGKTVITMIQE